MNKSVLMRNAHTTTMAATAALAAAIGAATTAMAVDEMKAQGTTSSMGETFFDRAVNWTNETLNVSIPPSDPAAADYNYKFYGISLRSPGSSGLHVFHSQKFTVSGTSSTPGIINEALASGVGTNRFENQGLVLGNWSRITPLNSRYGDVTYEGEIAITADNSSRQAVLSAGYVDGNKAGRLRLAGTLKGAGYFKLNAGGVGARTIVEADATGFTGRLVVGNEGAWTAFDCPVFNGNVETFKGGAIGTERATTAQLKSLTIDSSGTTLIVPFSENAGRTGTITVTNAFSQAGTMAVQLCGDLPPPGKYPVLRLASGCTGDFDQSQISFGGFVTDLRVAKTVSTRYAATALSFATEGDGSCVLYVDVRDLPTVITMR
ncbi:MAG: hypothetical protein ILM98_08885 [Kiritimatiellae bacterium]|nr:hypothetical protein [Kiritimatiellia bacterium]